MRKKLDLSSVLVIGSGPIVIGQACEFDYSGTQACLAIRLEGVRVILVNSNPATVMTDPETADITYIEPITPEVVEKIIAKERPDALLSTVGGQTALNCGLELWRRGVLDRYGVKMIGAGPEAIEKAENRQLFNEAMARLGLEVPRNKTVSSLKEALSALELIGLPVVIRPSFTLGGSGGGVAHTKEDFIQIVKQGLRLSLENQVVIDESLVGWKEYEMEVIRDKNDNGIIVCSIENIDPMGVHTGDSITVAPALTLTDKEYQTMRDASLAILREIGVETGGANVQFGVNPKDGRMVVIEMNPRVSRSSALASKATGFSIARVAAQLAIGLTLDEITSGSITEIPASFEPTIDYVVTKIPYFNFDKFLDTKPLLTSSMHSVGEIMSIGRCFSESLQKGLCSLERGFTGFDTPSWIEGLDEARGVEERKEILRDALKEPTAYRILLVAEAFRWGITVDELHQLTAIDPWFLREIAKIIRAERKLKLSGLPTDKLEWLSYKKLGFSDSRIGELAHANVGDVRRKRHRLGVRPVYKRVDACAAEFASSSAYLYSCYEGGSLREPECESDPSERKKVIILGSGPNRIGQGIEFDYSCVQGVKGLSLLGFETIMVNCNPETVSTDSDTSDKLYFEPLTGECVLELVERERQRGELLGVIVQMGGQTPLKLADFLKENNIPILGTSPESINLAEDRESFQQLLLQLKLRQPDNIICHGLEEMASVIEGEMGYPVVVRPSHVLGGKAMEILTTSSDLKNYREKYRRILPEGPILVERFLEDAVEIDVDAVCDGQNVFVAGIMEHIERAGVHSGDSACVLPPYSLEEEMISRVRESTTLLARAIGVVGLMNVQYVVQKGELFVLEVNPRASRTAPFVAKAMRFPLIQVAAQVVAGKSLSDFKLPTTAPSYYSIKDVALPFARFSGVDFLLGPEMRATGEGMGWGSSLEMAYAKAQLAISNGLSGSGKMVILAYSKEDALRGLEEVPRLLSFGFELIFLGALEEYVSSYSANTLSEVLDREGMELQSFLASGKVKFVICTDQSEKLKAFRRLLVESGLTYFSTYEAGAMGIRCFPHSSVESLTVAPL